MNNTPTKQNENSKKTSQWEYELRGDFQELIRQYLIKTGGKILTWDLASILSKHAEEKKDD